MKMIVIIIAALAILCGGGAGVYFMFMQPAEAAATDVVEDSHKQAKADHGKDDGHGGLSSMHFVELSPLVLPIIDENGASQVVSMIVALEVSSAEDAGMVTKMTPRLKDAYLQDMYGVLNKHAALRGGQIRLGFIKKRLGAASDRVLGDNIVQDVLLQVVQQRPI